MEGALPRHEPVLGHLIWWDLLVAKIMRARVTLPRGLRGVVQLEIAQRSNAPNEYFHILVLGHDTVARSGVAEAPDTWVGTSDQELEALLFGDTSARIRVSGRAELFIAILDAAARSEEPRSILAIRSEG